MFWNSYLCNLRDFDSKLVAKFRAIIVSKNQDKLELQETFFMRN